MENRLPPNITWKCSICAVFIALTLRALMNHYYSVHNNDLNFLVRCGVNECPAKFTRYHSFYKHVVRRHPHEYGRIRNVNDEKRDETDDELSDDGSLSTSDPQSCHDDTEINSCREFDASTSGSGNDDDDENRPDLQKAGAYYILKVKERNKISQVAMDNVIESTSSLFHNVLESVKKNVIDAWSNHDPEKDFSETISETFKNVQNPFDGLETNFHQVSYIKKNLNYVHYREEVLGTTIHRKKRKNKRFLAEKEESFIYIPILESLAQLFSNERIARIILKKANHCDTGIFYDICDGELYKNDSFFIENPDALQVIIYHDGVEVCNPLGAHSGTHKIDMFYYTLGNLNPKVRSKRCAIRLLGIVNSKLVKKYGYNAILRPMIDDLKKLENGHPFIVDGKERTIFGKVVSCAGDTEGQHEWGGFKVGVGFAFQKCRHCQCQFEAMQEKFCEQDFTPRTQAGYERHCREITEAPSEAVKRDLKVTYGINHRSSLCDLHDFDISVRLPQDIMHTLLEGVVQYELRNLLLYYIDCRQFTLMELNQAINNQEYGYSEVADKPGPLKETVFQGEERYKLKYKAAQARLFLRLLPFILSGLVDEDEPFYVLLKELIAIVQIVFSPVISLPTVNLLKVLIAEHLSGFKQRFPDVNITPKLHYMIHIPQLIKQIGPLVRHSCFGFESAHNYFKEVARKQNFKNITKSLAERCQLNECSYFGGSNEDVSSHPLFATERNYGVLTFADESDKRNLRAKFDSFGMLPGIKLQNIYKVSWVICHGTKFSKNGVIACGVNESSLLPIFGSIKQVWVLSDFVYFECLSYETLCFSETYQAYEIQEIENVIVICPYENLVDCNVFHIHKDSSGKFYIPVKYDITDLIEQHVNGRNPLKF